MLPNNLHNHHKQSGLSGPIPLLLQATKKHGTQIFQIMKVIITNNCHRKKLAENQKKKTLKTYKKNPIISRSVNSKGFCNGKKARLKQKKTSSKGNKKTPTKEIQKLQPERSAFLDLVQNLPPQFFADKQSSQPCKKLEVNHFFDTLKQYVKSSTSIDFK